jgi:integral membrane protein (TIGR00529 family)
MLDFFLSVPSFVKIGSAFAAILALNRFGLNLGISILLSSTALSFWSGASGAGFSAQFCSLARPENLLMLLVIAHLLLFTEALSQSGRMRRTIDSLKNIARDSRFLYGGLPALVGLLPMPGGALFSAPLVDSVDSDNGIPAPRKMAINYWFRHIWEYWWPLYPGVILALRFSGLPAALFFAIQIPFTFAAVSGGYFFLLRPLKGVSGGTAVTGKRIEPREALAALGPIAFLVASSIVGSTLLPALGVQRSISNLVALLAGLLIALSIIFTGSSRSFTLSARAFCSRKTLDLLFLVLSIQLFSAVLMFPLKGSEVTLVSSMRDELMAAGVPFVSIAMLVPFISGFVTGIAFAFVGASFPLVFALLGDPVPLHTVCATTALAYGFGFLGMMLSPVHICFVVTGQYFRTRISVAYRYIIGPASVVALAVILLSGLYYLL